MKNTLNEANLETMEIEIDEIGIRHTDDGVALYSASHPRPLSSIIRAFIINLIFGVDIMTIEDQVAALVAASEATATALTAIQTTLTAIQTTLANPASTVDLTPIMNGIAAIQAQFAPSPSPSPITPPPA